MNLYNIQKEQIKNYLLENPTSVDRTKQSPYIPMARYFNVDQEVIRAIWRNLRRKGLVEQDFENPPSKVTSIEGCSYSEDKAEITKICNTSVKTLDELIEVCDIDTDTWDIESWSCRVYDKQPDKKSLTSKSYSISAKLKKRKIENDLRLQKEILLEELNKEFVVKFEPKVYENKGNLLLEICIFDAHFSKLSHKEEVGDDYNIHIAGKRFTESIEDILSKVDLSSVGRILFPIGNDLYNVNGLEKTTVGGTPQDVDVRFFTMVKYVKNILINTIERLTQIAPVDVITVPANHDLTVTYMTSEILESYFRTNKNVSIDTKCTPRKYYQYGRNSFMFSHGDKEKHADLALIFATEQPKIWYESPYHFIQLGHFHSNRKMQYLGVGEVQGAIIQIIPSISSNDRWHQNMGFLSQKQAKGFLFDPEDGMVAELTHTVKI